MSPRRRSALAFNRSLGLVLLAVWLILSGLAGFEVIRFAELSRVLFLLAIAAGILLLLDR